jgi:hypothetical protein
METLHFEGRDVPPYAVYAAAEELIVGNTYFMLHFVDDRMSIPELKPVVFIGRTLEEGISGNLYFQDASSYIAGVRYASATGEDDAEFHTVREGTPLVFEFEKALDRLLYCSLTRSRD